MTVFEVRPDRIENVPRLNASTVAEIVGTTVRRPPIRMVHIGLGAFHRAHQLWFTAAADQSNEWGVLAFTGRKPDEALVAVAQDGLFTLIVRSENGETRSILTNLVGAKDGTDVEGLAAALSDASVAVVTLTITEAGYLLDSTGQLDPDDTRTQQDIAAWLASENDTRAPALQTPLGRLAYALDQRRKISGASIAVVPCDNFADNGTVVRDAMVEFARRVDTDLAMWLGNSVSFVSTVVDRITPATTDAEIQRLTAEAGYEDRSVVSTEPFAEWVLCGDFPAGRPEWERVGARFVDDVRPYQKRKLWILNGGHTLLASAARHRGHVTVADAMDDLVVRRWLNAYWDHVEAQLGTATGVAEYRRDVERRYGNSALPHRLDQIASDSLGKLRIRTLPLLALGRQGTPGPEVALLPISGWVAGVLRGHAGPDFEADAIARAAASPDPVVALIGVLDAGLSTDASCVDVITRQVDAFLADHEPLPAS